MSYGKAVLPGRMRPAEAAWRTHAVAIENHVPQQAILESGFWSHVAARLRPLDRIEVMDDAATWLAVLLVRTVGAREAEVTLLWSAELAKRTMPTPPQGEGMRPVWRGFGHKWTVMQGDIVLRAGMDRPEAEAWIRAQQKPLDA